MVPLTLWSGATFSTPRLGGRFVSPVGCSHHAVADVFEARVRGQVHGAARSRVSAPDDGAWHRAGELADLQVGGGRPGSISILQDGCCALWADATTIPVRRIRQPWTHLKGRRCRRTRGVVHRGARVADAQRRLVDAQSVGPSLGKDPRSPACGYRGSSQAGCDLASNVGARDGLSAASPEGNCMR